MRNYFTYLMLLAVKGVSKLFWRHESKWLGNPPDRPWETDIRIVAILHHTSLYEPIFAAVPPNSFLRRIAHDSVIPIAEKTLRRPIVGRFFSLLIGGNVVPITRKRDETWRQVVVQAGPHSMMIILPEGRMKRKNGLDSEGRPMTMRGGIADLLQAVGSGQMLIAYSGGLHHIQAPGELFPRLFKTVRMNLELVDIASYRERLLAEGGEEGFRRAVVRDLEDRKIRFCPPEEPIPGAPPASPSNPEYPNEEPPAGSDSRTESDHG